jgi:predicted phosphodiesterase
MLIAVVSDLHGNLEATHAVFAEIDQRKPDRIICLGDLAGYNACPNEVIDFIRGRNIHSIMGNHDAAVCGLEDPWFFRSAAKRAIQWQLEVVRQDNKEWLASLKEQVPFNHQCLGVHGSPTHRDDYIIDWLDAMRQIEYMDKEKVRLCFFGHSHRQSFFSDKGATQLNGEQDIYQLHPMNRYFLNPGAVGQPRDRDPRAAYLYFDVEKMTVEFKRVNYDIESAQRRIIEAGLPSELAKRLAKGK